VVDPTVMAGNPPSHQITEAAAQKCLIARTPVRRCRWSSRGRDLLTAM